MSIISNIKNAFALTAVLFLFTASDEAVGCNYFYRDRLNNSNDFIDGTW